MPVPRPSTPPLVATRPAVGYLRVSTEDQSREDKTSLAYQREQITALAGRLGCDLLTVFEDPGVSGATADRPGLQALFAYCASHPQLRRSPGFVLVLNDSRWGRFAKAEEATYWRVHLERSSGWVVRFVEGDDTDDATGRTILRALYGSQATAYREAIKKNAKQGARGAAAAGFWQNEAPLAYRREAIAHDGRRRVLEIGHRKAADERVRLTLGPDEEVALVRWMFEEYASGRGSLGSLARDLMDRWPSRRWSRRTTQAVLTNPTYLGHVVWCRRPHDKQERQDTPVRDASEWVTAENAHPALVTQELFDRVAERLAYNRFHVRSPKTDYLLSGLMTCAHCGQPYLGAGGPKGPPNDPERYRFYRDRGGDARYANCSGQLGTLQKRIIEPLVLNAIGKVVSHPDIQAVIRDEFDAVLGELNQAGSSTKKMSDTTRSRLAKERERLVEAVGRGLLTDEEIAPRLRVLREQIDKAEADGTRVRFQARQTHRLEDERTRLLALAADFAGQAQRLGGSDLRELLRPWLHKAVVDKVKRTVTLSIRRVPELGVLVRCESCPG
jgi:DNA invertase Pin-like site-specific DNA recombinase